MPRLSKTIVAVIVGATIVLPTTVRADTRTDARRYFTRGMAAIAEGRYREGIDNLLKAYDIKPHPNVLYNVARAFVNLNEYDDAIDYFEQYLEAGPRDVREVEKALRDLRVRTRLRDLVDDGMTAIAGGRYREGVRLLQEAYDERPHANLLFNIARAQEEAGDLEIAIANFQAYLASSPKDVTSVKRRIADLRERVDKDRTKPTERPTRPPRGGGGGVAVDPAKVAEMVVQLLESRGTVGAPAGRVGAVATKRPILTDTATGTDVELKAKGEGELYEEVVVTASRRAQSPLDAPNAVTIITAEDIRLSGARSIPDVLRRVPGMDVMAMSYADWNVAMRGFNRRIANKLLILVDGRTAFQDFLGGMLWLGQSYDLIDIERIEVVRGPGSAIYGANAYAGIVNIILKRPEDIDGSTVFAGGGNGSVLRAAYQFGKRYGQFGLRASVGWEQGDKWDFEFDPSREDYTAAVPRSTDDIDRSVAVLRADAHAEYNFDDGAGRLYVAGGVMTGYAEFYGVSALRNQNNDGLETSLRIGFDSELFSLQAFWNRLRTDTKPQFFRTGLSDLGSHVEADLIVVEPVFRPTFEFFGEHQLVIGAEYRHKLIEWNYIDEAHSDPFFAAFIQDQWKIDQAFTVLVSYRLDLHPLIGLIEQPDIGIPGSPRLALIYHPAEGQAIRASFGTAFRVATQAENYLSLAASSPVAGVAIRLTGEDELKPEDIITVDLGYLLQGEIIELELVGYFNRVNNLIVRTPLMPTGIDEPFDTTTNAFIAADSFYVNEDRVFLAVGGEVATRLYPIDGLDIGASYALQYIFDQETGDRFTDSPMHKATLWGQLRTGYMDGWLGFDVGAAVHYTSDQDWIEPEFDQDDPSGFRLDPSRVDQAVVVTARLGLRLFRDQLELALSGTNLMDVGENRHIEHPFGNRAEARVFGSATARF